MQINDAGLELIKHFEGLQLSAYLCPAGVPTIGYGHTKTARIGQRINKDEADALLQKDVKEFEGAIANWAANNGVSLNENEFAALVSLAYNIGIGEFAYSTVARKLKEGDRAAASNAFLMWDKADGKVLAGLARRRANERDLFLKRANPMTATANFTLTFKASSFLKVRPASSKDLSSSEKIAFSKGAALNVAAIALDKEAGHHLITLGQVNGKQLEYLGRNTLWVFGKDVEISKGGKLYANNPVDSVGAATGMELFIPRIGKVTTDTFIIPSLSGGGFLTWGMATHNGTRIPGGSHVGNIMEIARRFEQEVKPLLQKRTKQQIQITSWYRPEPWNSRAGGVSNSSHLSGGALDFWVDPLSSVEVYRLLDPVWDKGLGFYANGISHLDCSGEGKRRWQL